jgi:tetratricopeptide (TPR) repeat protein
VSDDSTRADRPSRPSLRQVEELPDFGPRYRVVGRLGKGGMGEVYRAYDTELKVEVALKIVRGDSEHDEGLARFRREIALARKVTSPNVLRVYDLDEHEGLRFLSMELVEGDDLGAIMKRDGKLPVERAIKIFRQVCTGLAAAHAEGVVHRDLKPQNVLVDKDDRVRVADFGLARSIGDSGMTASGAVLGSPAYMSPEQVKGDPIDERSDIYSLGVMLHQLVTGATPFQADTPHAVMEMRLHKPPPRLREVVPEAPAQLEAIVERCLAIEPGKRFASVPALIDELAGPRAASGPRRRRLVLAAGAVGCALAALAIYLLVPRGQREAQPAAPTAQPHAPVAVAPDKQIMVLIFALENRTGDPAFDGVDTILEYALHPSHRLDASSGGGLAHVSGEVGPEPLPIDDHLGRALAEERKQRVLIVHGSIATKGQGFTLTITATDAVTGDKVFARSLDATPTRVVPTLAQLAAGLREALGERVPDQDRERTGASAVLEADHEFVLGRRFSLAGNDGAAIPHLREAIARDADFALAHASLAVAYTNRSRDVEAVAEYRLAFGLADRMSERDRLRFLGTYYAFVSGESDRSISAYRELLETWPDDDTAQINLALAYAKRREFARALELGKRAAAQHPRNALARSNLASYLLDSGDLDGAVAEVQRVVADFPRPLSDIYRTQMLAEALRGHRDVVRDGLDHLAAVDPDEAGSCRVDLALFEGRVGEPIQSLERAIAAARSNHDDATVEVKLVFLGEAQLRHGDKAAARVTAARVIQEPDHIFAAAMIQLAAGDEKAALASSRRLSAEAAPSSRALAKVLEAEAARLAGHADEAIAIGGDALRVLDVWQGHFALARAQLDAKRYAEAKAQLDICFARRGEVADGYNDLPGLRYVPPLLYYRALAEDGLGDHAAVAKDLEQFLAWQPDADHDPLVDDARARLHR